MDISHEQQLGMAMYSQEYLLVLLHSNLSEGRVEKLLALIGRGIINKSILDLGEIYNCLKKHQIE